MKPTLTVIPVILAGVVAQRAPALADPDAFNADAFDLSGALDRDVRPPGRSIEIAIGGGYTQGAGGAGSAGSVGDVAGPGGGVELQLGYRATPRFSLGLYGTLARFRHGEAVMDGGRAHGATAGVHAVWHSRASRSLDPWIGLGAGWRGMWLTPVDAARTAFHGVELLRVQLGIDYRFTHWFAIAPVIGASASLFLVEGAAMAPELTAIQDKRLNLSWFTGVLGRFDIGG